MWMSSFPNIIFIEETVPFPVCVLGSLAKDYLIISVWVYLWALYCFIVFMPLSYCFDYYSFIIQSEIRKCDASSFILLSQDCFGYSESLMVPYEF